MDRSNERTVRALARDEDQSKIFLLRAFDSSRDFGEDEVPDPYGMEDRAFQEVLHMVERSVEGLLNALGVVDPSGTSQ